MKDFTLQAKSIWAKECPREVDQYVAFRYTFDTACEGVVTLCLFANSYYNLYVDGAFLHRGPFRRHESCAEYDVIDCYLTAGKHTVAVSCIGSASKRRLTVRGSPPSGCAERAVALPLQRMRAGRLVSLMPLKAMAI